MPSDGEYFITPKGRRFRNSLRRDSREYEDIYGSSIVDFGNPLYDHNPSFAMDPYSVVETSGSDLDIEPRSDRGPMEDTKPRSATANTIQILDDLKEEPQARDPGWSLDTLEWLSKHGYTKFVLFNRSIDVNFKSDLDKPYRIK